MPPRIASPDNEYIILILVLLSHGLASLAVMLHLPFSLNKELTFSVAMLCLLV